MTDLDQTVATEDKNYKNQLTVGLEKLSLSTDYTAEQNENLSYHFSEDYPSENENNDFISILSNRW